MARKHPKFAYIDKAIEAASNYYYVLYKLTGKLESDDPKSLTFSNAWKANIGLREQIQEQCSEFEGMYEVLKSKLNPILKQKGIKPYALNEISWWDNMVKLTEYNYYRHKTRLWVLNDLFTRVLNILNALKVLKKRQAFGLGISLESEGKFEQADKKGITQKPLFMDIKNNILFFNETENVILRPKEINLITYMRSQEVLELEQILTEHFKIKLTEPYKHSTNIGDILPGNLTKPTIEAKSKAISKPDRGIFDTLKSNANKKCKPLKIGDLIIKHGDLKKFFKLSRKIKIKDFLES